jgi:hypothetical protein
MKHIRKFLELYALAFILMVGLYCALSDLAAYAAISDAFPILILKKASQGAFLLAFMVHFIDALQDLLHTSKNEHVKNSGSNVNEWAKGPEKEKP